MATVNSTMKNNSRPIFNFKSITVKLFQSTMIFILTRFIVPTWLRFNFGNFYCLFFRLFCSFQFLITRRRSGLRLGWAEIILLLFSVPIQVNTDRSLHVLVKSYTRIAHEFYDFPACVPCLCHVQPPILGLVNMKWTWIYWETIDSWSDKLSLNRAT